ncbi:MAG: UMP kinase [Methylocystis sp.]|nr:UMP kinase [Methylocystis sp.]MCA3584079.1 UMP kinase [Methylocystis sp.]MCA3588961.1 UMP kinase [Methylocystis sp.]MCA3591199.1 UMP kinase [Methylocystis sp.]
MAKNPKRFLVKVSGEALMGPDKFGLDPATVERIAADLAEAARTREIAVVVGGGNIFRGMQGSKHGVERNTGDSMGRLATIINALALADAVRAAGAKAVALTADPMPSLCRSYFQPDADRLLSEGQVVVLGGGTGQPFFTTDTAAALRAAELDCAAILKATTVDGVYTADPKIDPAARRYEQLTHDEAIERRLGVMDTAAFALARENALPIIVFSIQGALAITNVLAGNGKATHVVPA